MGLYTGMKQVWR